MTSFLESPNVVIRHLLLELIMKSRMVSDPKTLDHMVKESIPKFFEACRYQDRLLTEKEVVQRHSFLTLTKLRNMRTRGTGPKYLKFGTTRNSRVYYRISDIESWIVVHEQLEPLLESASDRMLAKSV